MPPRTSVSVRGKGLRDHVAHVGVCLDEARARLRRKSEEIVPDEHLSRTTATGPDTDGRHGDGARDLVGHSGRDRFEHDGKRTRLFERLCVGDQPRRGGRRAALRAVAAEHRRRLRREADVSHDGNARGDDGGNTRERRACSLELDCLRAAILHQAHRVEDGVLV